MDYLGLRSTWARLDPTPNPVNLKKLDRLQKVLIWIYGSKKAQALPIVRSQNPDIKRLGDVLANLEARTILKATGDLKQAHAATVPRDSIFAKSLINARQNVLDATSSLSAYDGENESLLKIAGDVKEASASLFLSMSDKYRNVMAS